MSGLRGGTDGAPWASQSAERLRPAAQPQFLPLPHCHPPGVCLHLDTWVFTLKALPNLGGLRIARAL